MPYHRLRRGSAASEAHVSSFRIVAMAAALCLVPFACRSRTDAGGPPGPGDGAAPWHPAPGTSWQWQLTGTLDVAVDVALYDVDLFDTPAETIAALHARQKRIVCYLNAGAHESWRPDAGDFPAAALGDALDGWEGERWLDTRSQAVRDLMLARMDLAVEKGCDAVEPDNVDAYANDSGFVQLTAETQLDYNRFLAAAAHARGLSIALKNDLEQVPDLVESFDFALVERCLEYGECELAAPFLDAGKAVLAVEYGDEATANEICPRANAANLDALVKRPVLDAFRIPCR